MPQHRWKIPEIEQVKKLYAAGVSPHGIAVVLREYHDVEVTAQAVRCRVRREGLRRRAPMPGLRIGA